MSWNKMITNNSGLCEEITTLKITTQVNIKRHYYFILGLYFLWFKKYTHRAVITNLC